MIDKNEVATIMEITSRHVVNARRLGVEDLKARLVKQLNAEIKDNLDPEWNHAIRRAIELVQQDSASLHPVLSGEDIQRLTQQVADKIARLVPNHQVV